MAGMFFFQVLWPVLTLPAGEVEVHALVRQRNAFRYGFQFLDSAPARGVISRTCRELAIEESLRKTSAD